MNIAYPNSVLKFYADWPYISWSISYVILSGRKREIYCTYLLTVSCKLQITTLCTHPDSLQQTA